VISVTLVIVRVRVRKKKVKPVASNIGFNSEIAKLSLFDSIEISAK